MKKKQIIFTMFILTSLLLASCGINKEVHQKALNDLATAQKGIKDEKVINESLAAKIKELEAETEKMKKDILDLINEKMELAGDINSLKEKLIASSTMVETLMHEIEKSGASIENLEATKEEMDKQREKMMEERDALLKEQEELKQELDQLRKMKEAAEKRNAEFRGIMEKLKTMIDSGTLSVNIRKGRMIVSLSNDILFPSGRTTMTDEGKVAVKELSETLQTLEDRTFLVVGHSDPTPIKTKRFPSNWELSSQRAIEVVKLMVENGVKPEMLSAAGQAEFDPIADNEEKEGMAQNRRVEIIFMPKIEEMPGFELE
jgi:chemotaxis protein MotB